MSTASRPFRSRRHRPGRGARRTLVLAVAAGLAVWAGCATAPPPSATEQGWLALEAGDWRQAVSRFESALAEEAGNGRAWHGLAAARLAGRDPEAALKALGRLARVDAARFAGAARPTYADALAAAVPGRLARDRSDAALQAARALAALEPRRNGLPRLLGRTLVAEADRLRLLGRRDAALPLFEEACRRTPGDLSAWVGAAEILLEQRRGADAIRLLETARRSHPTAGVIRSLTLQAMNLR